MNLRLDPHITQDCHDAAKQIAADVMALIDGKTTVSIERATARLLGETLALTVGGVPGANVVVDAHRDSLGCGIAWKVTDATERAQSRLREIHEKLAGRRAWRAELETPHRPLRYVLTATGDIDQDVTHALAVAEAGGDIIALIRSTAQSLWDYVPEGATHEGHGGTFNTQENFRILRSALDEWSTKHGRYVRLSGFCSGLCMPEIAAIGAMEGLDNMVNDALYGILYRDINPLRTLIDQRFSRLINGWAGTTINTGEDNYLRTDEAVGAAHTVTASQFINYYLAKASGVPDAQIGLGNAFEIDPAAENALLYEIAQAQLARQLFPDCPVKYMPPTRYMTGDFYATHAADTLFNLVGIMADQGIQTVGVPSEGLHTPWIQDRPIALRCMDYVHHTARDLGSDIEVKHGGIIETRAQLVLTRACGLLEGIARNGLMAALQEGVFGDVECDPDGGHGTDGIVTRADDYFNPVEAIMAAH